MPLPHEASGSVIAVVVERRLLFGHMIRRELRKG